MAQTKEGKKFNRVPTYIRRGPDGTEVAVKEHLRSNPSTSLGRAKAKAK
jgi:hypothetical protein